MSSIFQIDEEPPPRIGPAPAPVPAPHNLPLRAVPPPCLPRRAINLIGRPKQVGEEKTVRASQIDCYGYTWGGNKLE